jgi:hypothetical protein
MSQEFVVCVMEVILHYIHLHQGNLFKIQIFHQILVGWSKLGGLDAQGL